MGLFDVFKSKKPEQESRQQTTDTQNQHFYSFIDSDGKKCSISIVQEAPEKFAPNQQEAANNNMNSKLYTAKIGYSQDHKKFNLDKTITFGCCNLSLLEYLRNGQQQDLEDFFKGFFSEERVSGKLNNSQTNGDYIGSILYTDAENTYVDKLINEKERDASVVKVQQQKREEESKKAQKAIYKEQKDLQNRQERPFAISNDGQTPPQNRNFVPGIKRTSPEGAQERFTFTDKDGYVVNISDLTSEGRAPDGFQLYKAVISHANNQGNAARFRNIAFELPAEMRNFIKDPDFAKVASDFFSKTRVDRTEMSGKEYIGGMREQEEKNGGGWGKFTNPTVEKMVEGKNMASRGR